MYATPAYLYQQIQQVLLVDTSGAYFDRRWDPVYSKLLTINKGVDNVLLFEFLNQDQKPVNITGSILIFRLIDQTGIAVLAEKEMTVLNATTGRVKVVLSTADTIDIPAQPVSWSIQRTQGDYVQAAYVDDASGGRGSAVIVDSVQPQHVASQQLIIPTIYGTDQQLSEYYSSEIIEPPYLTTFQMRLDIFTGTIKFQGKTDYGLEWLDASDTFEFLAVSGWRYFTVSGNWAAIRVVFNRVPNTYGTGTPVISPAGVVTAINLSNAGSNFRAAPRVIITGKGSGARAVSTINNGGEINSVTVTDGGAGYGSDTQVQFDSGQVLDITYR